MGEDIVLACSNTRQNGENVNNNIVLEGVEFGITRLRSPFVSILLFLWKQFWSIYTEKRALTGP